ncbi:hypothetical protein VNO77_16178 [Canavalia gladiata]|uniref:Uncharacterized protein n=1 Tax=Canavalia gladiata TaxID=3824 RepID=A0AAN9QWD1_CANGL
MGGCVSAPKDVAKNEGETPIEKPTTPNAEGETVAQENKQETSEKIEEPLVDLSEAKEEKVETKEEKVEKVEVKEEKVEKVEVKEEKVEAATETKEAEKEEAKPKTEEPKVEEKKEEPLVTPLVTM